MSIAFLGDKLKCQIGGCDEFAKILRLNVKKDGVQLVLECPAHPGQFQQQFSHAQFQKVCDVGLVEDQDVQTYQLKYMILFLQFVKLSGGYDRVFILEDRELVQGPARQLLICNECSGVHDLKVRGVKIPPRKKWKKKPPTVVLDRSCRSCGKKSAVEVTVRKFLQITQTGLLEPELYRDVRERLEMSEWTPDDSYGLTTAILAPHAAEALGLVGDPEKKCMMCGMPITKGVTRCPRCGNDVE